MTAQVAMSQLLASFASSSSPSSPTAGQLWYDTGTSTLKVYDGSSWTSISTGGGGGGVNMQVFLSDGTFTVPAGVTAVKVTLFGGGGGGAAGIGGCCNNADGWHGGAGGFGIAWISGLTPGQAISVTLGAGGAGGNQGGGYGTGFGNDGGTTTFGAYATATGGKGGNAPGSNAQAQNTTYGLPGTFTTTGTLIAKMPGINDQWSQNGYNVTSTRLDYGYWGGAIYGIDFGLYTSGMGGIGYAAGGGGNGNPGKAGLAYNGSSAASNGTPSTGGAGGGSKGGAVGSGSPAGAGGGTGGVIVEW